MQAMGRIGGVFDLRDVFVFGGLGLVSAGLHEIYPPAALVIPGALLVWMGMRRSGG